MGRREYFPDVTLNSAPQNYFVAVVNDPDNGSQLVNVAGNSCLQLQRRLAVTGVLGTPLTISAVNTALGGGTADCQRRLQPHS